jgi:hypothetical protein
MCVHDVLECVLSHCLLKILPASLPSLPPSPAQLNSMRESRDLLQVQLGAALASREERERLYLNAATQLESTARELQLCQTRLK